jgi:hypothetical protein
MQPGPSGTDPPTCSSGRNDFDVLWEAAKARNLFVEILRGQAFDSATCLAAIVMLIAVFLAWFDVLIWGRIFGEHQDLVLLFWTFPLNFLPAGWIEALWVHVGIIYVINTILLDRFLRYHDRESGSYRLWIKSLHFLVPGIPVLGLCVIPGTRLLRNLVQDLETESLLRRLITKEAPIRKLRESSPLEPAAFFFWIVVSNLYALRAAVTWLSAPELSSTKELITGSVVQVLHRCALIATVACYTLLARKGALWGRRYWISWASGFLWLPVVLPLYIFAVQILLSVAFRPWTFMQSANVVPVQRPASHGGQGARGPSSGLLRWALASVSTFEPKDKDRTTRRCLLLYREKTFLLAAEIVVLVLLAEPLGRRFPLLSLVWTISVSSLCLLALLGLFLGLGRLARHFFRRLSSLYRTWQSSGKDRENLHATYLMAVAGAVVAGLNIGLSAAGNDPGTLGASLAQVGLMGIVMVFLMAVAQRDLALAPWLLLFLYLKKIGQEMLAGAKPADFLAFDLDLLIPLVLCLALAAGLYRCRWLLRPFRGKDIFNPSLPTRLRRRLAFLAVTACLPLSGFLVPVWIRLRTGLEEQPLPA